MTAAPRSRLRALTPPEGVPIGFVIASLGSRFGAQFLDLLITISSALAVLLLALWLGLLSIEALGALFVLSLFFLRAPYYILAELVWNGRTLGKRITRIRVVSLDGRRLTPHQIVARNLMKEVEVFLPAGILLGGTGVGGVAGIALTVWFLGVLVVPFVNRQRQRLGDMMAGTIVVETPRAALLPDLAMSAPPPQAAAIEFRTDQLDIYGRYELQVLEEILRDPPKTPEARTRVTEVVATIRRKIAHDEPVPEAQEWDFLLAFYRAQRAYLESRHLFGDTRDRKRR